MHNQCTSNPRPQVCGTGSVAAATITSLDFKCGSPSAAPVPVLAAATPGPDTFCLTDGSGFHTLIVDYKTPATKQGITKLGLCGCACSSFSPNFRPTTCFIGGEAVCT